MLSGTSKDSDPPLEIAALDNLLYQEVPRYHTALVARLKGDSEMKARLCLRGDTIGVRFSNFDSPPTVERSMVGILVSTAVTYYRNIVMVDVTRDFLQSQHLAIKTGILHLIHPA